MNFFKSRFSLFLSVGIAANLASYMAYLALTALSLAPVMATSIVFILFTLISFKGHRSITFKGSRSSNWSVISYYMIQLTQYIVNAIALVIFVEIWSYDHKIVQALLTLFLALVNYWALKNYVFYPSKS